MSNEKNIFEDTVKDIVDRMLSLKFDICKCNICRNKMHEITLSNLPKIFISPSEPKYNDIVNENKDRYYKDIVGEAAKAINIVGKNPPHKIDKGKEGSFKQLIRRIYQDRGIDFSRYHQGILKRRVALRLRANNVNSYSEYLKIIANNPAEYESLFDVLTINVSEFFRDKPVWEGVKRILDKLFREKPPNSRIKIWSAGCAKGEEPYSLAILADSRGYGKEVDIYATDLDRGSISDARRGIYDVRRIRNIPDNLLKRYFDFDGKGNYVLKDFIKERVIFKRHDLINSAPLPETDLITCRNVFIYFTKPLQETILNKFYNSLKDRGYLIIGESETILTEAKLIFEDFAVDKRIYRKKKI